MGSDTSFNVQEHYERVDRIGSIIWDLPGMKSNAKHSVNVSEAVQKIFDEFDMPHPYVEVHEIKKPGGPRCARILSLLQLAAKMQGGVSRYIDSETITTGISKMIESLGVEMPSERVELIIGEVLWRQLAETYSEGNSDELDVVIGYLANLIDTNQPY